MTPPTPSEGDTFSAQPMEAVPLDYFERRQALWAPMARLGAWVAIVYSIAVMLEGMGTAGIYLWQRLQWSSGIRFERAHTVLIEILPALAATVMLPGGVLSLQMLRRGRAMMLWSAAAMIFFWAVVSLVAMLNLALRGTFSNSGVTFFVHESISLSSEVFFRASIPAVIWLLFIRREMREVFGK